MMPTPRPSLLLAWLAVASFPACTLDRSGEGLYAPNSLPAVDASAPDVAGQSDAAHQLDSSSPPDVADEPLPPPLDASSEPIPADAGGDANVDGQPDAAQADSECSGADSDGDGVPDDCDPCPHDNPDDTDSDGVCDSVDACPGYDDSLDDDGDGVPNGCDTCPLDGPAAAPIALPASAAGITVTAASINGAGNAVVVGAGQNVSLSMSYSISDCGCTGCRDQIEVGLVPGPGPLLCAYDGVPGCQEHDGSFVGTLAAPSAPGVYYLRFNLRQDYGCKSTWWGAEPGGDRTFGAICVP